ncbi:unnamed protein product [Closterium sp. NIES-54]
MGTRPVLTLLLPSAFDEYLLEIETNKRTVEWIEALASAPRWGQPEDCTWDESAVGADDDVVANDEHHAKGDKGAETGAKAGTEAGTEADVFPEGAMDGGDDNGVEYWSCDGLPKKLPILSYLPTNRKCPHPSFENRDACPPSPRHKPSQH